MVSILWSPLPYFGAVAGVLYLSLLLARSVASRWVLILAATAAGVSGSLWWWTEWGPWYFSLIHGAVWGTFVGFALSWRGRTREHVPSNPRGA